MTEINPILRCQSRVKMMLLVGPAYVTPGIKPGAPVLGIIDVGIPLPYPGSL